MKRVILILFVLLPTLALANVVPTQHKNGKWGYRPIGYTGKFTIGAKFEQAHPFAGDYAFVCQKGLWGIINKEGKFVVKPCYTSASVPCGMVTIIELNSKYGLLKGVESVASIGYDKIEYLASIKCFRMYSNGKQGLVNGSSCELACGTKYDYVGEVAYGIVLVKSGDKYGLFDTHGTEIRPIENESIKPSAYETLLVKANGKCGLLDKKGQPITAMDYDSIEKYEHETFLVKANGKCGLLDKKGQPITTIDYDSIDKYKYNTFLVKAKGKYGLFNQHGEQIIPVQYDSIEKGLYNKTLLVILVKADNKYGVYNLSGKQIIPVQYDSIEKGLYNETLLVKADNKYGVYDQHGKQIIPVQYDSIEKGLYNETLLVKADDVCGIYNLKGELVVPVQYGSIEAGPANTFLATVYGKKTLLNAQGKFITEQEYKHVVDADNGVLALLVDGGWLFFDMKGKQVSMPNNIILYTTTDGNKINVDGMYKWEWYNGWSYRGWEKGELITSLQNSIYDGYGILVAPKALETIYNCAFRELSNLKSIQLPDCVSSIGSSSFYNCSSLTSITIPDSATSIGKYAFADCKNLTSVTIGNSVTSIAKEAFKNCWYLQSITIPDSVTEIGYGAFRDCYSLTKATIGNGVTMIKDGAFDKCNSLTSVTIGNGVTEIGYGAFSGCYSLTSVYISDLSSWCKINFGDSDANPLAKGSRLYLKGKELTKITIPADVKELKSYVFTGCQSLTSITIPNNVTSFAHNAFVDCSNLQYIYCNSMLPPNGLGIYSDAIKIYVPRKAVHVYKSVWSNYESQIYGYDF